VRRVDEYREALRALAAPDWDEYLTANSGLPGPRGNIELAMAVAEEATSPRIHRYAGSGDEFLAVCGAVGLGRLLAEGEEGAEAELRGLASDRRWRVREGVAMGLQRLGDADPARLVSTCRGWLSDDSWLVLRAVVAGLCEPRLLDDPVMVAEVFSILDEVTRRLAHADAADRRSDDYRVLRKAMGYCWSVAVAAMPDPGFDRFERWAARDDPDVAWLVRENLQKNRMRRADPERWGRLSFSRANRDL
jgi:hypothetical protein